MKSWDVIYKKKIIDTVYYDFNFAYEVKNAILKHDEFCNGKGEYFPYPRNIQVKKGN